MELLGYREALVSPQRTTAHIWQEQPHPAKPQKEEEEEVEEKKGQMEGAETAHRNCKLGRSTETRCRQVEGACIHVHSVMLNIVLTMVRKLHSIALMLNLPLLHTGQMVLH